MAGTMFLRVDDVARELDISKPYAYKLVRRLNQELEAKGCITIAGRIDKRYFYERFYSTRKENEEGS